ncbi:CHASE2 domain-containing protein [Limnohabitans sp. MORI2]|uniref:CHASE2 domain-containing protein n=1 Tax=Limnohabitans sp. MORI2 TaxID=1751150 RepID=UPI00248F70BF|nr:CHASE2 domain-containing protein [Limnohabitans sp. MORI2]
MKDHKQRKRRLHIEWRATALIAVVLLASLIFFGVTQPLSNVLYDHLMRLQGFRPTHNIVIIAVDDQSLEELGGWPLARNKYTQLLDQLDDACCRPKSIGFDLLFLDATRDDEELAVALKKHRSVLPIAFQPSEHAPMEWRPTPPVSPLAEAATLSHNPDKKPSDLFKELPKFLRQVAPHEKCAECLPKGLAANAGIARP